MSQALPAADKQEGQQNEREAAAQKAIEKLQKQLGGEVADQEPVRQLQKHSETESSGHKAMEKLQKQLGDGDKYTHNPGPLSPADRISSVPVDRQHGARVLFPDSKVRCPITASIFSRPCHVRKWRRDTGPEAS